MEPPRKATPRPRPVRFRALGLAAGALAAGTVSALAFALLWPAGGATPAAAPAAAPAAPAVAPDTPAATAREFLARAGAGDSSGSQALVAAGGPGAGRLAEFRQMQVRPLRGGPLPGASPDAAEVLLWSGYRRAGAEALGYFQLRVVREQGTWRVAGADGPVAPREGWAAYAFPTETAGGQRVAVRGPAVLWAPRRPDPDLARDMAALQQQLGDRLPVVLVMDLPAPAGWEKVAQEEGWTGAVWRVRGRLEELPVPALWTYKGATGVLLDADGKVVASLGALDASRYNAAGPWPETAVQALAAHGLINR